MEAGSNSIFCSKTFLAEAANSLPSSPSSAESFRPGLRASFSLSTMGMVHHLWVAEAALLARGLCSAGQSWKRKHLAQFFPHEASHTSPLPLQPTRLTMTKILLCLPSCLHLYSQYSCLPIWGCKHFWGQKPVPFLIF